MQAWQNGKPGVIITVSASRARTSWPRRSRPGGAAALRGQLPASVEFEVIIDRTRTIRASLHEVELTLVIASCW